MKSVIDRTGRPSRLDVTLWPSSCSRMERKKIRLAPSPAPHVSIRLHSSCSAPNLVLSPTVPSAKMKSQLRSNPTSIFRMRPTRTALRPKGPMSGGRRAEASEVAVASAMAS